MKLGGKETLLGLLAVVALALGACAKRLPPPGGKPDIEPPRISATSPDSGAVNVSRRPTIQVTFSEAMMHGDPSTWVLLGPYASLRKFEWSKSVLTVTPSESLRADQSYTLVVTEGATDARGNRVREPRVTPFTTGTAFPPGQIRGRVEGHGHEGRGVLVWAYRQDLGHAPDSTARDFDALSIGEDEGGFRILGLPVPSRWKLYAFHDVNRTLSFEPDIDHLTALPDTIQLTPEHPVADSVVVPSIDPSAPGEISGTVADSLAPPGIPIRILVESLTAPPGERPREFPVEQGAFRFALAPGSYRLRAYVDLDRSGRWDTPGEPATDPIEVRVEPAARVSGLSFVAPPVPPPGGGSR